MLNSDSMLVIKFIFGGNKLCGIPEFGNSRKDLGRVAATLIFIIEGGHPYPGGIYISHRVLAKLAGIRRLAGPSPEEKISAIVNALEDNPAVKLDPDDPEAHLLVDRISCRHCHQRPCEDHQRDTYRPPVEVTASAKTS